jgi:hypothetical protein
MMVWNFQIGNRIYNKSAQRPNRKNITEFLTRGLPLINAEKYKAMVVGRVVYDAENANDFDLSLEGSITDYSKLENLFFNLYDIGYKQADLTVDIKWCEPNYGVYMDPVIGMTVNESKVVTVSYYNLKTKTGSGWVIDRRNQSEYKKVSEWLVESTVTVVGKMKPHQIKFVEQHGFQKKVPAEDFIKNLDSYLKPTEYFLESNAS